VPAGVARDEKTQPQFKVGMLVSGNFFDLLGVRPHLGRGFVADEDRVPGRDAVVVLAYDFWRNELAADPSIVGKTIRIGQVGGLDFHVIGVAPESFTGMDLFIRPAFYIPAMMGPKVLGASDETLTRRNVTSADTAFYIKGRLKPGVSLSAANADVAAVAKVLEQTYPASNRGRTTNIRTEIQARLDSGPVLGGIVAAVFGVMIVILLIACANVMNLMLSRGLTRSREMIIRLSIGARRTRLIRQLMLENLLIALAGGLAGIIIAAGAVEFFSAWELPGDAPIKLAFQLDRRVLFFTLIVSGISSVLFGLAPAFRCTRADLAHAVKAGESSGGRTRFIGRNTLLTVQIAGSIVLIMSAAQMYRNTMKALTDSPGFIVENRLTLRLDPSVAGYSPERSQLFYRNLVERARVCRAFGRLR
jgi:predicted permease